MHLASQPPWTLFSTGDDDPFPLKGHVGSKTSAPDPVDANLSVEWVDPDIVEGHVIPQHQGITPRPAALPEHHRHEVEILQPELAIGTEKLRESLGYLTQASAHLTNVNTWLPRTYCKAMLRSDLWIPPMVKEMMVLKECDIYEVVPWPRGKKVVGSKSLPWNFHNLTHFKPLKR
ncbi:hypothetical protein P691DRAFT_790207 [Macrolepiota fuliginosa MF-IS2]|uniref:Uncharacterized protein n=1 Tax=Macrolepiota fuliginosa MF-IS2 TaxID=1400762 RepID=A0A9P5WZQ3_9AGAR|nr:hypothetical protein P691DRAFT_790207 [Macrolepiota fuliginosa MF-IS2]